MIALVESRDPQQYSRAGDEDRDHHEIPVLGTCAEAATGGDELGVHEPEIDDRTGEAGEQQRNAPPGLRQSVVPAAQNSPQAMRP